MNKYEEAMKDTINSLAQHLLESVKRHTGEKKTVSFYRDLVSQDTYISRLQELVKRTIPMKMISQKHKTLLHGEIELLICGNCERYYDVSSFNFCPHCGQALGDCEAE